MSKPRVPLNEAAVWLEGLGCWPMGPADVQTGLLGAAPELADSIRLVLSLVLDGALILSNSLDRERLSDEI